jgi:hypothetical protein
MAYKFNPFTGTFDLVAAAASDAASLWTAVENILPAGNGSELAFATLNVLGTSTGEVDVFLPDLVADSIAIGQQIFVNVQAGNLPYRGIVRRKGADLLLGGGVTLGTELVWTEGTYSFTCAGEVSPGVGLWFVQQTSGERSDEQVIVSGLCESVPLPAFTASGSGVDQILTADADGFLVVDGTQLSSESHTIWGSLFLFGQTDPAHNGLWSVINPGAADDRFVLRRHPFMNRRGQVMGGKLVVIRAEGFSEDGSVFVSDITVSVPTDNMSWARVGVSAAALTAHTSNTSNPHATTAAQVGADAVGTATGAIASHVAAGDPHTQYALDSDKNAANGYAGLTASKLAGAQQTYGTGANTACEGNDARLSDARAPTSHALSAHAAAAADLDAAGYDILNLGRAALNLEVLTSASNVLTLDFATANDKACTLTENVTTISTSNEPASGKSQVIKLLIIGASTYTLPASWADVDWWISDSGSAPSAPGAGKRLLVTLWAVNIAGTVHVIGNAAEQP